MGDFQGSVYILGPEPSLKTAQNMLTLAQTDVILVFSVIQFRPARYEDYVYPPWAQAVGWMIALASIIWIPLAAAHTLWVLPGSFTQKLKQSITPFSLDEDSDRPYYQQKGDIMDTIPNIAVIESFAEKPAIQTNL